MKNKKCSFTLIILSLVLSLNVYSGTLVSLKTRGNVEQPFWLLENENAVASVILFAGGDGKISVNKDGIHSLKGNFVVRNRNNFSKLGFNVAVVDVPSDRSELNFARTTKEHATDIKQVIKFLRDKYKKPVWLIGTSRGTTSVANIAARLNANDGPDGVVFTASISEGGSQGESMTDVSLEDIKQPVLFVHHEDDECWVCPSNSVSYLAEEMEGAKLKEIKMFSGGHTVGRECGAQSYHGFLGIEDKVVPYISDWVKAHL